MAEPRTLSVAWLPKGVLKSVPDRVNLEEDELLEIKEKLGKVKADESEEELESEDENMETVSDEKKALRPELEKVGFRAFFSRILCIFRKTAMCGINST